MAVGNKGGESLTGENRNIDHDAENKFYALKRYAERYGYKWGFFRDIGEYLFINNSFYIEAMESNEWKPIEEVLK